MNLVQKRNGEVVSMFIGSGDLQPRLDSILKEYAAYNASRYAAETDDQCLLENVNKAVVLRQEVYDLFKFLSKVSPADCICIL